MKRIRTAAAAAVALAAVACEGGGIGGGPGTGTETGNPDLQMTVTAYSSNKQAIELARSGAPTPESPVVIDKALMGIEVLTLLRGDQCAATEIPEAEDEELENKEVIDLTGAFTVPAREVSPDDRFCGVFVELEDGEEMQHPRAAELGEARLLIEGRRANGDRFVLQSENVREMVLRTGDAAFTVGGEGETLYLAFDVARWFEGLDLDGASASGGVVRIDEDNNAGLLARFEAQLAGGAAVYGECGEDHGDDFANACTTEFDHH